MVTERSWVQTPFRNTLRPTCSSCPHIKLMQYLFSYSKLSNCPGWFQVSSYFTQKCFKSILFVFCVLVHHVLMGAFKRCNLI